MKSKLSIFHRIQPKYEQMQMWTVDSVDFLKMPLNTDEPLAISVAALPLAGKNSALKTR